MNSRNRNEKDFDMKIIKYSSIGVIIVAVIAFAILIYVKNLNQEVKEGTLTSEQISNILNNENEENTQSASSEIGKSVNEVEEKTNENNIAETSAKNTSNQVLTTDKVTPTTSKSNSNKTEKQEQSDDKETETVKLNFEMPVEGEIVRDFATDSLIYSETLQEWTTYTGIDIKADKTTVVKSAEAGTVKSIKNDPRYGLTIIVEHDGGFQTVYANLLSSEFVVEGENVEKGQSLGTVGNSAAFEIADEAHLHFEILKDSIAVDPTIYLK